MEVAEAPEIEDYRTHKQKVEEQRKAIDKLHFELNMQVKSISTLRAQESAISAMELQVFDLD